ncbi:MAG: hypothetical protein ABH862_01610 [Candidatus Omnitrophota bacterium]
MFIKKKHMSVVIFSSVIISVVFIVTLAGYHIYIQWKQDTLASKYRNSIYKLTAELFKNDVLLSNVSFRSAEKEGAPALPLLEGNLKNNSEKKITSISVEIALVDPEGVVVYRELVNPLEGGFLGFSVNPSVRVYPEKILLPGEDMTFCHFDKNCPREVTEKMSTKTKFAKDGSGGELKLVFSIAGMSVL